MSITTKRAGPLAVVAIVVVGSILYLSVLGRDAGPGELVIATATQGGTYYPLGGALALAADHLQDKPFGNVRAIATGGSKDNIRRLLERDDRAVGLDTGCAGSSREESEKAQVAFVAATTLVGLDREQREQIKILVPLYEDYIQVVVRKDAGIGGLRDLENKKVFKGPNCSGTWDIATEILRNATEDGIAVEQVAADSFATAAARLQDDEDPLDAAFFASGVPTTAVSEALGQGGDDSCCELLDLAASLTALGAMKNFSEKYEERNLDKWFYRGQEQEIKTLSTSVYLVARSDLRNDWAYKVVEALYDNLDDILLAHAKAEDISATRPDETKFTADFIELHPGVLDFWDEADGQLTIATGALGDLYYKNARVIRSHLEQRGQPSRVVHTGGSIENLRLLAAREAQLAFMQYDVALAAQNPAFAGRLYGSTGGIEPVHLQRIATLHPEIMHAIMRLPTSEHGPGPAPTLDELAGKRIGVGPPESGSRLLAGALLREYGVAADEVELPAGTMVNQLNGEELDALLFMGGSPSQVLRAVLDNPAMQLLSVEWWSTGRASAFFEKATFEDGMYGSLRGRTVQTVKAPSVLVTTADSGINVDLVARALVDARNSLGLDGDTKSIGADLAGLDLHPDALAVYEERGLRDPPIATILGVPSDKWNPILEGVARVLVIVGVLIGAYKGILKLRRDGTKNEVGRRIFQISVEASEEESVTKLVDIRREIRERVKRRYWRDGELNTERWRALEDLVNLAIAEARDHLERALIAEIRKPPQEVVRDREERSHYYVALRERLWTHLERGELNVEQHARLRAILAETELPGFQ